MGRIGLLGRRLGGGGWEIDAASPQMAQKVLAPVVIWEGGQVEML
jgi:hypothetical protein